MDEVKMFEMGSENVFADLGLPNADELFAKAQLASRVSEALRQRKLSQKAVAKLLNIDQPKVSRLLNGKLMNFSTERLMHFLILLGRDVEIVVSVPAEARAQGTLRVSAA